MGTIYKLNFDNGEFYVGQTTQSVFARITQHKATKGKGSPLLAFAFEHSNLINFDILEDGIPTNQMDAREQHWIRELQPTLNTTIGGKSTAGLAHPRLKYTKEQIKQVLHLYLNTAKAYNEISKETGVGYSMVHDIVKRRAHTWVWENVDPKLHESARELRKVTFRLFDIDNHEHEANTIRELADILNQPLHVVYAAVQGHKSSKGLSLVKHPQVILTDPQQEQFEMTLPQAKEFLKTFDELSKFQQDQLTVKHKASGGWNIEIVGDFSSLGS